MITKREPQDWSELQEAVGKILSQCGFNVEVEKTIEAVRGKIEFDVYAEEAVKGRKYVIACECKHWKSRVPQAIAHSFRTQINDIGANVGYVISTAGFQSGAFEVVKGTNVELVTWKEFQALFLESWFEGFFTHEIVRKLDALMTYAEPFLPSWWDKMSKEDQDAYLVLRDRYARFAMTMQHFGPYTRLWNKPSVPPIPLRKYLTKEDHASIPDHILDEAAYGDLLEVAIVYGEEALKEFRAIRDKYVADENSSSQNTNKAISDNKIPN
jgi:restriction system protein